MKAQLLQKTLAVFLLLFIFSPIFSQKSALDFSNVTVQQQPQTEIAVAFDLIGKSSAPHDVSVFINGVLAFTQKARKHDPISMTCPISMIPLGTLVNGYYEVEVTLEARRSGREINQMKCIVPIYP